MFKFAGGWMHVRLMKFYPAATRSHRKPYHYEEMFMDGTKEKLTSSLISRNTTEKWMPQFLVGALSLKTDGQVESPYSNFSSVELQMSIYIYILCGC